MPIEANEHGHLILRAPWTPAQVAVLNRWQESGDFRPYTCGSGYRTNLSIHPDGEGKLVATEGGWVCPNCDYKQNWAHVMSAQSPPPEHDIVPEQPHERRNR